MNNKNQYFKIGLFVISAVILLALCIIAIGSGRFSKEGPVVETYFDSSVQGLDVGAKVKYRGVLVGSVIDIDLVGNRYEKTSKREHFPYVAILIRFTKSPFMMGSEDPKAKLQEEIRRGLRTQLQMQGITGSAYLEIDYINPHRNPPMEISWTPENPYIPSAPSALSDIISAVESLAGNLEQIDFVSLSQNLERLIATAQVKLDEIDTRRLNSDLLVLADNLKQTSIQINKLTANPRLEAMLDNFSVSSNKLRLFLDDPALGSSLKKIDQSLSEINTLLGGKNTNIALILSNLRDTTENLNHLIEELTVHPSQIINSPPPPQIIK